MLWHNPLKYFCNAYVYDNSIKSMCITTALPRCARLEWTKCNFNPSFDTLK